jgi:hypothetical protein
MNLNCCFLFNQRQKCLSIILFLIGAIYTERLQAQTFITKDSLGLIPLLIKTYHSTDINNSSIVEDKLASHHKLTSPHSKFEDGFLYGNFGSQLIPFLHINGFSKKIEIGRKDLLAYNFSEENIPYYLTNRPISEIDFTFFGNGNEEFKGYLAQNLSDKLYVGAGLRRSNNGGFFKRQENLHNSFYVHAIYQKNRLRSNLELIYNDMKRNETGGAQFNIYDSLIPSRWQNAQPNLSAAATNLKSFSIHWNNRISLISQTKKDTTRTDSLPMQPISSSLYLDIDTKYGSERQLYSDNSSALSRSFYGVIGKDTSIQNMQSRNLIYRLENKLSLNYNINDNFKINGYHILSQNDCYQNGGGINQSETNDIIAGIGGELYLRTTSNLTLKANIYKPYSGYTNRDFLVSGHLQKDFPQFSIHLGSQYTRQLPGILNNQMITNGFQRFYNLETQNTLENSFEIQSKKLGFKFKGQQFLIENFLSYDQSLNPNQISNNFIQISAQKDWSLGILYAPSTLYYQNSIFARTFFKQTLAYKNSLFENHLNLIIGADLLLNLNMQDQQYHNFLSELTYNPNAANTRLFPRVDFFATLRIHRVLVSLVFDNIGGGLSQSGVNYTYNTPITPSNFLFRMSWTFSD